MRDLNRESTHLGAKKDGDGEPEFSDVGVGVGFAGTPASHSLTGSVPVQRAGMASGTADLQRDLGDQILASFSSQNRVCTCKILICAECSRIGGLMDSFLVGGALVLAPIVAVLAGGQGRHG